MNTDVFMLEGRAYSWRKLRELRREQLEALRQARGAQPALFELREDHRPAHERTASGRYQEPTLLDLCLGSNSVQQNVQQNVQQFETSTSVD